MNFWKGVFSDNGNPSFSRVATGIALVAVICWITHIVRHLHAMPDFSGPSLFVGTLYGLNVGRNIFRKDEGDQK
jgi:hypothetical protein